MLNLNSIMLSSGNSKNLIEFYNKIFETKPTMGDEDWAGK